MTNTVYTTHAPGLPGLAETPELERLWRASWSAHGWEPVVLEPQEHQPLWKELHEAFSSTPTVNPPGYRDQCITRWADFFYAGGGLMVDMDLMNLGFPPDGLNGGPGKDEQAIFTLSKDLCPCGVIAGPASALNFIDFMLDEASARSMFYVSSDQEIFRHMAKQHPEAVRGLCFAEHYGNRDWQSFALVHFGAWPCTQLGGGRTKLQIIQDHLNACGCGWSN